MAHTAFGLGAPGLDGFFQDWVYCFLIVVAGGVCVYRQQIGEEEAILELRLCSGTQFDPMVVEASAGCLQGNDQTATNSQSGDEREPPPRLQGLQKALG